MYICCNNSYNELKLRLQFKVKKNEISIIWMIIWKQFEWKISWIFMYIHISYTRKIIWTCTFTYTIILKLCLMGNSILIERIFRHSRNIENFKQSTYVCKFKLWNESMPFAAIHFRIWMKNKWSFIEIYVLIWFVKPYIVHLISWLEINFEQSFLI